MRAGPATHARFRPLVAVRTAVAAPIDLPVDGFQQARVLIEFCEDAPPDTADHNERIAELVFALPAVGNDVLETQIRALPIFVRACPVFVCAPTFFAALLIRAAPVLRHFTSQIADFFQHEADPGIRVSAAGTCRHERIVTPPVRRSHGP